MAALAFALRLHHQRDLTTVSGEIMLQQRTTVITATGRTTKAFAKRDQSGEICVTKDNEETLNAFRVTLLGGRPKMYAGGEPRLLCLFGMALENGASPDGKLVPCPSDYPQRKKTPHWVARRAGAASYRRTQERLAEERTLQEEIIRLATGHLVALLLTTGSCDGWADGEAVVTAAQVSAEHQSAAVADWGIAQLLSHYPTAWERLVAEGGPFRLTPYAGVKATPLRWDLLTLCRVEAERAKICSTPLLSVVASNAGAIASGLLQSELGTASARLEQVWESPHTKLASNLAHTGEHLPPPPLWFPEQTTTPPRHPTHGECAAATEWWHLYAAGRRSDKGGIPSAARSTGSSTVMPPAAKRQRGRPKYLDG